MQCPLKHCRFALVASHQKCDLCGMEESLLTHHLHIHEVFECINWCWWFASTMNCGDLTWQPVMVSHLCHKLWVLSSSSFCHSLMMAVISCWANHQHFVDICCTVLLCCWSCQKLVQCLMSLNADFVSAVSDPNSFHSNNPLFLPHANSIQTCCPSILMCGGQQDHTQLASEEPFSAYFSVFGWLCHWQLPRIQKNSHCRGNWKQFYYPKIVNDAK